MKAAPAAARKSRREAPARSSRSAVMGWDIEAIRVCRFVSQRGSSASAGRADAPVRRLSKKLPASR